MSTDVATEAAVAHGNRPGWRSYLELTKPRLSLFSVFTALASYLAVEQAVAPGFQWGVFLVLAIGVSFAAGGAGALNQWWERRTDPLMNRTATRPLPEGRTTPAGACIFGMVLSLGGVLILWAGIGILPAFLTLLTLLTYLLWYTPMKRRTPWATEIGAIPGALPPLVGWTAATGSIGLGGLLLFAVLFFWQIPHFMAIAWLYRWDYARGGMPVRTLQDPHGFQAARFSVGAALGLAVCSLLFWVIGFSSLLFALWGALVSLYFARLAYHCMRTRKPDLANRKLFLFSLLYLPLWFVPLLVDRRFF